jgi:hypothetical protein
MHFSCLPSYISIETKVTPCTGPAYTVRDLDDGGTVKVTITSTIHKGSPFEMPHSWSEGFCEKYPARFRGDVHSYITDMFRLTLDPVSYS